MPLFEQFPYTNFHELNLDTIVKNLRKLNEKVDTYLEYETIKYADPLQWSIAEQYEKNTVVVDTDGSAYLSTQPVPLGISITDTNYWTPIGNFSQLWDSLKAAICSLDLGSSPTATQAITEGTWFFQQNALYRATQNISNGSVITTGAGGNSENITIEEVITELSGDITDIQGDITDIQGDITTIQNTIATLHDEHLIENMHIVFAGDSNWAFGSVSLNKMLELMPGCTGEDIHTGGGSWETLYAQVASYAGDPDIFLLNAGGNSIPNGGITTADIGGALGAPDVRDHSVPDITQSANQTMFNYMKATFNHIRNTWPRCLIYVIIRSNQPFKPRSAWYYLKFYEQQICQEWGVPVIDANNIMNLTYWNTVQKAIYNAPDEQHFTTEAYNRYLPGIGAMLEACAAVQFSQAPNNYFVPTSVIDTTLSTTDVRNTKAMAQWVIEHCCPTYCAAWSASGRAQAYISSGSAASGRFIFTANYNDNLQCNARGLLITEDRDTYIPFDYSTFTGQLRDRTGKMMNGYVISGTSNLPALATLPAGSYYIADNAATTYVADSQLPNAVANGGMLIVVRSAEETDASSSGYRVYQFITRARSLYVGSNSGGGAITWDLNS